MAPYLRTFAAYQYNRAAQWKQAAMINYKFKTFPEKAAVLDVERGALDQIREPFWQTDTSVSFNSWGYITTHEYKPVNLIPGRLVC